MCYICINLIRNEANFMNKEFGSKLRFLRKSRGYTQKDLAMMLNVGQTTIANYENGTRVPDVFKFKDIADLFQVSLDYLIGKSSPSVVKYEINFDNQLNYSDIVYKEYMECLLNGDKIKAANICLSLLEKGMDISKIYQNIIGPSLAEVGILWEKGVVSIWKEHMISEISLDIIGILNSKYKQKRINNKTILALTPGAELHNIGLKMVCSVFELAGWNSIFLGSSVPTKSVLESINEKKPDVIALSITNTYHIDSTNHLIQAIRQHHSKESLSIIVGGLGLKDFDALEVLKGIDYYIENLEDLISNFNNF